MKRSTKNNKTSHCMRILFLFILLLSPALANATLALSVSANPDPVQPEEVVHVTLTVTNTGTTDTGLVTLQLDYPDHLGTLGFGLITDGGTCPVPHCTPGETVTWDLGTLAPGAGKAVSLPPVVNTRTPDGTILPFDAAALEDGAPTASDSQSLEVQSNPGLDLALDENRDPVAPGETLIYTLSYGNRSTTTISGLELQLPLPPGVAFTSASDGGFLSSNVVIWDLASLAAGSGGRRQAEVTVDLTTADGALLEIDRATLVGTVNGKNYEARSALATRILGGVPLELALTPNPNPAHPGETVYTALTVTNTSSSIDLSNVTLELYFPDYLGTLGEIMITDSPTCSGLGPDTSCVHRELITWSLGEIKSGMGKTVSLSPLVRTISPPPDGTLTQFLARAAADNFSRVSTGHTVRFLADPPLDLALDESVDPVTDGESFTYSLSYSNRSTSHAYNTTLHLPLPEGVVFQSATGGGLLLGGDVVWDLGALTPGSGGRQQVTASVDATIGEGSVLGIDAATLNADVGNLPHITYATLAGRVQGGMPLKLALAPNADPLIPDEFLHTELTVSNESGADLSSVILELHYPDHLATLYDPYISDGGTCPGSGCTSRERVTWDLGSMAAGTGRTISLPPRVPPNTLAPDGTLIQLLARAKSGDQNATTGHTVQLQSQPTIELGLDVSANPVAPGETLVYSLTYGNRGPATLYNAQLSLPLPAGVTFVSSANWGGNLVGNEVIWNLLTLPPGSGGREQVVVTVDPGLPAGEMLSVDSAILTGTANAAPLEARASQVTRIQQPAPLSVTLTVDTDPAQPTDTLQTQVTVTNEGTITLDGVTLQLRYPDYLATLYTTDIMDNPVCSPSTPATRCVLGDLITWNLGSMGPGDSITETLPPQVQNYIPDGTLILYRALAVGSPVNGDPAQRAFATYSALIHPFVDTDSNGVANVFDEDDDGDGLPDRWERTYGLDPLNPDDAFLDNDLDDLTNIQEFAAKTSPIDPDTDDDGYIDSVDDEPLIAAPNHCSGDDPVVSNKTVVDSEAYNCRAPNSVTTNGIVVVESGGTALFMAPSISLTPGFQVRNGGTFNGVVAVAEDIAP